MDPSSPQHTHHALDRLKFQIPGMTLLATGVKFLKSPDVFHYLDVVCYHGNGWLRHISLLLAVSGGISIFTGIFRMSLIQLKTPNQSLSVSRLQTFPSLFHPKATNLWICIETCVEKEHSSFSSAFQYLILQGTFLLINLSAGLATVSTKDQVRAKTTKHVLSARVVLKSTMPVKHLFSMTHVKQTEMKWMEQRGSSVAFVPLEHVKGPEGASGPRHTHFVFLFRFMQSSCLVSLKNKVRYSW